MTTQREKRNEGLPRMDRNIVVLLRDHACVPLRRGVLVSFRLALWGNCFASRCLRVYIPVWVFML